MKDCERCGDCCRFVTVIVPEITPEMADYFTTHGFTIDGDRVKIPSECQHLRRDIEPTTRRASKFFYCNIYYNRPEICRQGECLH